MNISKKRAFDFLASEGSFDTSYENIEILLASLNVESIF